MNVSRLFDAVRQQFGIRSDAALARQLDVEPPAISKARSRRSISDALILRIHECLGMPVKEIRDLLI
jgi:plasmid maintenance system antidote protein VapI